MEIVNTAVLILLDLITVNAIILDTCCNLISTDAWVRMHRCFINIPAVIDIAVVVR